MLLFPFDVFTVTYTYYNDTQQGKLLNSTQFGIINTEMCHNSITTFVKFSLIVCLSLGLEWREKILLLFTCVSS